MNARRLLSLLAALALSSPLMAVAEPACAPGPHCPMAGLMADEPPCHGTAIQADDCCVTTAPAASTEAAPVIGAIARSVVSAAPASCPEPGAGTSGTARVDPPSTPLYRLFRALLI